jgi:L-proline amide hydrolase
MAFNFDACGNPEPVSTGRVRWKDFETWYSITGDSEAHPPVIVIHGGPGGTHEYVAPLSRLSLDGHCVIHYDQVGCGYSTALSQDQISKLDVSFFVDELAHLVAELSLQSYVLLGHSWGGMVAQEFAATQPTGLRGMILSSSLASWQRWQEEADRLGPLLPEGAGELYVRARRENYLEPAEFQKLNRVFSREHIFRGPINWVRLGFGGPNAVYDTMWGSSEFFFDGTLTNWTIGDKLAKVVAPTLVIWGEYDESTAWVNQEILDKLPHAHGVEIPHAAHCTWVDAPELYLRALNDFLRTLPEL